MARIKRTLIKPAPTLSSKLPAWGAESRKNMAARIPMAMPTAISPPVISVAMPFVSPVSTRTSRAVSPSRVIPIHYDSLTGPAEGPFRGPVKAMAFLSGGLAETASFLADKAAANPALQFATLPRFEEVVLFE